MDFKLLWCTDFRCQLSSKLQGLLHEASSWQSERVLCADLLAPEGYGEIIGGSMREDNYDALVAKMDELGMDKSEYEFYLDLRKYGSVPHGGFGIGIERMVTFVAGTKHIREAIPFRECCTACIHKQINRYTNRLHMWSVFLLFTEFYL